jgi:hypothetical protein
LSTARPGVWSNNSNEKVLVEIEPLKTSRAVVPQIQREAERLAIYFAPI